jgi:hypothetical protein
MMTIGLKLMVLAIFSGKAAGERVKIGRDACKHSSIRGLWSYNNTYTL